MQYKKYLIPDQHIFIAVTTLMILGSFRFWKQIRKSPFLVASVCYSTNLRKFLRFHLIRFAGNSFLLKIFQEMQGNMRFGQPKSLPFTRGIFQRGSMLFNNARDNSSLAKIKKIFYQVPFSAFPSDNNFLEQSDWFYRFFVQCRKRMCVFNVIPLNVWIKLSNL